MFTILNRSRVSVWFKEVKKDLERAYLLDRSTFGLEVENVKDFMKNSGWTEERRQAAGEQVVGIQNCISFLTWSLVDENEKIKYVQVLKYNCLCSRQGHLPVVRRQLNVICINIAETVSSLTKVCNTSVQKLGTMH